LTHLAERPIGELSGGQRQRVLLARALAGQPELLVMDEPFQGVDATSETTIVETLRELRAQGVTILMVHHDLMTVLDYCDWERGHREPRHAPRPRTHGRRDLTRRRARRRRLLPARHQLLLGRHRGRPPLGVWRGVHPKPHHRETGCGDGHHPRNHVL
ncbi:hypothetical protein CJ199_13955, partial [Brevibacterium paucivorans]